MITAREFFELHSILTAIVETELESPAPVPEAVKQALVQGAADRPAPGDVLPWVGLLDLAVNPHLLRRQMKQNGADDAAVRALLRFLVAKKSHSQTDRDKVDWLGTFFFQAREERTKQPTGWPKTQATAPDRRETAGWPGQGGGHFLGVSSQREVHSCRPGTGQETATCLDRFAVPGLQ